MPDLTKLQSTTRNQGFKNNNEYTGSFVISGTFNTVSKQITKVVQLPFEPDLADVVFNGPSDTAWEGTYGDMDPRPNSAWFKRGRVYVRGDDSPSYVNYPIDFVLNAEINGNTLIITADAHKQFVANLSLTATTVYYKVIDYSVF